MEILAGDRVAARDGDGATLITLTRLLLIDDARVDSIWLEHMLRRVPGPPRELDWVSHFVEAGLAMEADRHDLYFVDFRLGPDSGLDLIRAARRRGMLKPIIMLTGHGSEAVDLAATEAGANDYLVKGEFDHVLLGRTMRYAARSARALAELDLRAAQWQAVAADLKVETERRVLAEAELSQVLRRTVVEQEAERQRIARELHDSLGQSLTLLQLGLDGLARAAPEAARQAAGLKRIADGLAREINRLAWEIRPTALDDLGLSTAIRHLIDTWGERSHLTFDVHLMLEGQRLPAVVETTLYRVLQEALTNVARHAEAARVGIILEASDQEARLIIEDDGRGFSWEANKAGEGGAQSGRLGLLGMRERLSLVGGTLEVETSPGRGTTLFTRVPLRQGATAAG